MGEGGAAPRELPAGRVPAGGSRARLPPPQPGSVESLGGGPEAGAFPQARGRLARRGLGPLAPWPVRDQALRRQTYCGRAEAGCPMLAAPAPWPGFASRPEIGFHAPQR